MDEIDVMTIKRTLRELKIHNPVIAAGNGEEALDYLKDNKNEKPFIIILDLNMPRMNGIEFLKISKKDKELKKIPVIVLITSKEEQDVIKSYDLGVSGYMVKPVDYSQFTDTLRAIYMYWKLCKLPY
ncbi:response regulator [Clostridium sp. CX1]|uniref:response regulator n=1 Tax=Clostridium sp. CX1 TaxID=2978346 RepID=UPI0021BF481B|nr:response regulator [Clostridium sp. CX1]MCT8977395.1 response regulator [Clostridium sp. CX1]